MLPISGVEPFEAFTPVIDEKHEWVWLQASGGAASKTYRRAKRRAMTPRQGRHSQEGCI